MNCLYEAVAGAYVRARSRMLPAPEDDLNDAEENLEACRAGLVAREADLSRQAEKLFKSAADKKRLGDVSGARFALQERKRALARMEKVRNGVALLDKQLDALRSSELDKELMNSLKLSSQAMRKAGIGQGVEETERVMNELDDQMREASELTTVLSTPLAAGPGEDADDLDVDEELGLIQRQRAEEALLPEVPSAAGAQETRAAAREAPKIASRMDF